MQNQTPTITASLRTVFGKKTRFLRRAGTIPANIFGRGAESAAIEIASREMEHVLAHVPRSSLLSISVGSRPPETVLIRGVNRKPTTDELYHVDFYRVSMTERLRVAVSLVFVGEAPAARTHGATVIHAMDRLEVECLPGDLPTRFEVDLGVLEEIDDAIYVRDLALPRGVTAVARGDQTVARALAPTVSEEEEKEQEEEAAAEQAPTEAEGDKKE